MQGSSWTLWSMTLMTLWFIAAIYTAPLSDTLLATPCKTALKKAAVFRNAFKKSHCVQHAQLLTEKKRRKKKCAYVTHE